MARKLDKVIKRGGHQFRLECRCGACSNHRRKLERSVKSPPLESGKSFEIKTIGSPDDSAVTQAKTQEILKGLPEPGSMDALSKLSRQLVSVPESAPECPGPKVPGVIQGEIVGTAGDNSTPAAPGSGAKTEPPPAPGAPVPDAPAGPVIDLKGVLEAQAGTVLKAPFDVSNVIFSTDKFVIPDKQRDALVKQFVHLSNLFGWDKLLTEAKWIALLVFFVSYGGCWMGCFSEMRKDGKDVKDVGPERKVSPEEDGGEPEPEPEKKGPLAGHPVVKTK